VSGSSVFSSARFPVPCSALVGALEFGSFVVPSPPLFAAFVSKSSGPKDRSPRN
jgi:hypothetical protein